MSYPQFSANDFTVTTSGVARALGVSEVTTRSLADRGVLPVIRLSNGQRLFRPRDVERERERRDQVRHQRAKAAAHA